MIIITKPWKFKNVTGVDTVQTIKSNRATLGYVVVGMGVASATVTITRGTTDMFTIDASSPKQFSFNCKIQGTLKVTPSDTSIDITVGYR